MEHYKGRLELTWTNKPLRLLAQEEAADWDAAPFATEAAA